MTEKGVSLKNKNINNNNNDKNTISNNNDNSSYDQINQKELNESVEKIEKFSNKVKDYK